MSKKIPLQDLNFKFDIVLDKEKESEIQKLERWVAKQPQPFKFILELFFPYFKEYYIQYKVKQTMQDVDRQAEEIVKQWDEEDERNRPKAEIVEEGLFGEEGWSISISNPVVERRSEETDGRLGDRSNEIRLGEKLPDPWD
jgi:hypothetical protein